MSKSRRNYKSYDDNNDYDDNDHKRNAAYNQRRKEKRLKNQLRAKNYDPRYFQQDE